VFGVVQGFATFALGMTVTPIIFAVQAARRLSRLGFAHGDLAPAFRAELESSREERAIEYGRGRSSMEGVLSWIMRVSGSFTLIAAPLLIAGMPAWMLRSLLAPRPVRRVFRLFARPLVALVLFNGVLLFTHWPAVVEASVGSEPIHLSLHVLIVASALVMWWPVMSPLPEMPSLSAPGQMIYLFLQSLAPTIPASFLTFGHTPLYPVYATFPRIWGVSALNDQLIAGLIMKLAGGMLLWSVIAVIFFRWFEREQRDGLDRSAYQNVQREIGAEMGR